MNEIERGHKGKMVDIGCEGRFTLSLHIGASGIIVDVACFGLDAHSQLSDDRYMVFFNQKASPGDAVTLTSHGGRSDFDIDLTRLPNAIDRLVFAVSIDGNGTMKGLSKSAMTLGSAEFKFSGNDFDTERAVIVGEIYRRDGAWRYGAVGQGFSGGLGALLAHFGGTEAASATEPAPSPSPSLAPSKVVLSKVTLTKPGQHHAISLIKGAAAPRTLTVRATWEDNGDEQDDNDDLDLRVGILMADGRMKFVCAPDRVGAFDKAPFVKHLGDITSASAKAPATETVEVNPAIAHQCGGRVALVFSVYSAVNNGAVSVASLKPKMRMEYGEQVVECAFDFSSSKAASDSTVYTYVIGTAIIDGDKIILGPSGQTSKPGSENTPWLQWDGQDARVTINGPVVFKGSDASEFNGTNPRYYS